MFGTFSACAVVFVYFNIRETMGLSDKEKKLLYAPKDEAEERPEKEDYTPVNTS